MKIRLLAISILSVALVGCVTTRSEIATPFDPSQFAFSAVPGAAFVNGQVAFRTVSGAVETGSGKPIFLVPKNAYTEEMINKAVNTLEGMTGVTNLDQRVASYIRMTVVAPGGRFIFANVPQGKYYVIVTVDEMLPALIAGYNTRPRDLLATVVVPASGAAAVLVDKPVR